MENTKEITYISVDKLVPHPDNPRKDIGDVSELADSIKAKGILQNLTVVPFEGIGDRYTVIIGHRRLAAAKQAGLETVPCVIADMDEKEQIETMLLENMQRSDLTYYEQAEGFQLMFDFGETVESVAEKNGFSQTTVRKRVKLLKLDKEKFKESVNRGATLDDYMKLDEIEDADLRNSVLEFIGTNDFKWKLSEAKRKERGTKNKVVIIAKLNGFAEQLCGVDKSSLCFHSRIWCDIDNVNVPDDADELQYYYEVTDDYIDLYCEDTEEYDEDVDPEEQEREREFEERKQKLYEMQQTAYELRKEFVRSCSGLSKKIDILLKFAIYAAIYGNYSSIDTTLKLLEVDTTKLDYQQQKDELLKLSKEMPERISFLISWERIDSSYLDLHTYNCEYKANNKLLTIYDFLMEFGYEMSDEEAKYVYGAHELFVKPEKETQNDE